MRRQILTVLLIVLSINTVWAKEPQGQPKQIRSAVEVNAELADPFFKTEVWCYPWWIIEHDDGTLEDTMGGNPKDAVKVKQTAACTTEHQGEHTIGFCDATLDKETLVIYIHDESASTYDNLKITLKAGKYISQYWTVYSENRGDERLVWMTQRQRLILDKKQYKKGDEIKGKLEFECEEKVAKPKYPVAMPRTINVSGVFKTLVE